MLSQITCESVSKILARYIPIKLDRGGGFPWLFADYRKEINTAVMRHGGDKQTACLTRKTYVQTACQS